MKLPEIYKHDTVHASLGKECVRSIDEGWNCLTTKHHCLMLENIRKLNSRNRSILGVFRIATKKLREIKKA